MSAASQKESSLMSHPGQGFEHIYTVDETLIRKQQEMALEIAAAGKTAAAALELGLSAIIWTEHLIDGFESANVLPFPLACRPGCDCCCFNQVEVTPPEALLLGNYVDRHFSEPQKQALRDKLARVAPVRTGKSKKEIARMRRELPCPLLSRGRCLVYPVRPLVCRAMHSFDAEDCRQALESRDLVSVPHYSHRHDFAGSISQGLLAGCGALGCQAAVLDLAQALEDYFRQPNAVERWIRGEKVFSLRTGVRL